MATAESVSVLNVNHKPKPGTDQPKSPYTLEKLNIKNLTVSQLEKELRPRRFSVSAESSNYEQDKFEPPKYEKSKDAYRRIIDACQRNPMFRGLTDEEKQVVYDAMSEKKVAEGDEICKQGKKGEYFYIIDKGDYEMVMKNRSKPEEAAKLLETYKGNGSFGELSLLHSGPSKVSIVAKSDGVLWQLDGETFRHAVVARKQARRRGYERLLAEMPVFKGMLDKERSELAECLEPIDFNVKGKKIIIEDDDSDAMYIVYFGMVLCTTTYKEDQSERELSRIKPFGIIGECGLVMHAPRSCTVRQVTDKLRLLRIDKSTYTRLIESHPQTKFKLEDMARTYKPVTKDSRIVEFEDGLRSMTSDDALLDGTDIDPVATLENVEEGEEEEDPWKDM